MSLGPGFTAWIPIAVILVLVGIPVLAAAVSLRRATSRRRRDDLLAVVGTGASPAAAAAVAGYLARIRRGRRLGMAGGVLATVPLFVTSRPLLVPLAVAAGYLLGVLGSELTVPVPPRGPVRTAQLLVRRARDYVSRAQLAAAAVLAVLVVAAAALLTVRPYPEGLRIACGDGLIGPWYYGWPSAGWRVAAGCVAVAGLASCALVLRRIALRPAVLAGPDATVDQLVRRGSARAAVAASCGLSALTLAALCWSVSALPRPCRADPGLVLLNDLANWAGLGFLVITLAGLMLLDGPVRLRRLRLAQAPPTP
jgi:hypothetical protein